MIKAQADLPALVAVVMDSADSAAAQAAVAEHFAVSPQEAVALMDMPVRRMSQGERARIVEERDALVRWLQE